MAKIPKSTLNLKQFVQRKEVLQLYRDIFRTIRLIPDVKSQQELRCWARQDFRANQNQTDEVAVKMLLQYGRRSLNELRQSLHLSGACDQDRK